MVQSPLAPSRLSTLSIACANPPAEPGAEETTPPSDLAQATNLWQQANQLTIEAGRILSSIKLQAKRKFSMLLEEAGLEKVQVNKVIKAFECASEIPPAVAAQLGVHRLIQLKQPKYQVVKEAITPDDTPLTVGRKIKDLAPKRSSKTNSDSIWRQTPGGVNRYCQVPPIHDQEIGVMYEKIITSENITPTQAFKNAIICYRSVKQAEQSTLVAETEQTLEPTSLDEDSTVSTELDADFEEQSPPSPALSPIEDEQTRAQAELEAYMEEQSNAIAPEPKNIVYSSTVNSANTEVESIVTNYQENPSPAPSVEPSVAADTNQQPNTDTNSVTNIPDLPTLQTENPLYVVIGTNDCWEGEVVTIQQTSDSHYQVSRVNGIEWNNINPKHLTPISQDQAQILMNEPALAQRVFDEFGLAVGDTVEFVASEAVEENSVSLLRQQKLSGKISRLTLLGAFIDEGVPGQSWFPYDRLKKVSLKTDTASFTLERQEQLKQERNQKELIATAKIIKQCDREIVLAKEHLANQPLDDRQYAHTIHKIDINTTRRSQQLERITNFAHSNDIWLDLEALKENRLVLETGGEDVIADYLPLPWVQSEPTEPVSEPNPEPEDTSLCESLRQAQNWEQITQLTGRNPKVLALAVSNWSPQEKQKLIDYAVLYLESHPNAIFDHELDWLPLASVQKVYSAITFRVRDNSEGIGKSKWIEGCRFVDIEDYGKVDEIWTFLTVDNQEIYVVERKDIEVEIF